MHKAIQLQQERERSQRRLRWEVVKQTRASLKGIGWEDSAASEALKVARQKSRRSLAFESADTNNNNALSREEFRLAALELLKVAELDHMEGELTAFIENEFEVMDADKSGEMDREEFGAWYTRFHDWVTERKLMDDAKIDVAADCVTMPPASGAALLRAVLRHNKTFTELQARRTMLDADIVAMLAQVRKEELRALDVSAASGVDDMAVKALAAHCGKLQTLKLTACAITDDGLKTVAKFCKELRTIDVGECAVTAASLSLLHADCAVEGTPTEPPSPLKGVVDEAAAQEQSKRAGEWSTPPPVPPKPKKSSLCAVL